MSWHHDVLRAWGLPVIWDSRRETDPPPEPAVIYVYVPYGTPLPPGAQQALPPAKAPLAVTAGATGRK
jgi:hypothetical protein